MNRTVGFELEISDVKRSDVFVPQGYSWSRDETLYGTNGKRQSPTSLLGGELNTRPLSFTHEDMEELRNVFNSFFEAGGNVMWCNYFHCHVWVGDFTLDELKNVFLLAYHTNRFIKAYCDVKPYREFNLCCPTPTIEYVEKCREAESFEALQNVFKNSSNKGYIRHLVNINSYWKVHTVEFRMFASTRNFDELVASAFFAMRFVNYAKKHTEEDFKKIRSMEDFQRELKIHMPVAKVLPHLINAGDQMSESDRFVSRVIKYSSPMVKLIVENCGDELCCVNPNMFGLEMSLFQKLKRLSIYNTNEFNDVLYRMATQGLKIRYKDKMELLEQHADGTPEMEIVRLMMFHRIRKFIADNDYARKSFDAIVSVLPDSITKGLEVARKMVQMLQSCKYVRGTLNDALENENVVFYQYEGLPKLNSTLHHLEKLSDFKATMETMFTNYQGVTENLKDGQRLFVASMDQYLSLNRLGSVNGLILYSNIGSEKTKVSASFEPVYQFGFKIPPDDLEINDPKKLMIVPAHGKQFTILQHAFVKKVASFMSGRFQFIVYYDSYVLGAFAFDLPKAEGYDVWLLSDFTTNNQVKRLAKLILLCIKSAPVKKFLSRKIQQTAEKMYTKVYTTRPVSMKYRGPFKKVKIEGMDKGLVYEADFGSSGNVDDIIREYQKIIQR